MEMEQRHDEDEKAELERARLEKERSAAAATLEKGTQSVVAKVQHQWGAVFQITQQPGQFEFGKMKVVFEQFMRVSLEYDDVWKWLTSGDQQVLFINVFLFRPEGDEFPFVDILFRLAIEFSYQPICDFLKFVTIDVQIPTETFESNTLESANAYDWADVRHRYALKYWPDAWRKRDGNLCSILAAMLKKGDDKTSLVALSNRINHDVYKRISEIMAVQTAGEQLPTGSAGTDEPVTEGGSPASSVSAPQPSTTTSPPVPDDGTQQLSTPGKKNKKKRKKKNPRSAVAPTTPTDEVTSGVADRHQGASTKQIEEAVVVDNALDRPTEKAASKPTGGNKKKRNRKKKSKQQSERKQVEGDAIEQTQPEEMQSRVTPAPLIDDAAADVSAETVSHSALLLAHLAQELKFPNDASHWKTPLQVAQILLARDQTYPDVLCFESIVAWVLNRIKQDCERGRDNPVEDRANLRILVVTMAHGVDFLDSEILQAAYALLSLRGSEPLRGIREQVYRMFLDNGVCIHVPSVSLPVDESGANISMGTPFDFQSPDGHTVRYEVDRIQNLRHQGLAVVANWKTQFQGLQTLKSRGPHSEGARDAVVIVSHFQEGITAIETALDPAKCNEFYTQYDGIDPFTGLRIEVLTLAVKWFIFPLAESDRRFAIQFQMHQSVSYLLQGIVKCIDPTMLSSTSIDPTMLSSTIFLQILRTRVLGTCHETKSGGKAILEDFLARLSIPDDSKKTLKAAILNELFPSSDGDGSTSNHSSDDHDAQEDVSNLGAGITADSRDEAKIGHLGDGDTRGRAEQGSDSDECGATVVVDRKELDDGKERDPEISPLVSKPPNISDPALGPEPENLQVKAAHPTDSDQVETTRLKMPFAAIAAGRRSVQKHLRPALGGVGVSMKSSKPKPTKR